MNYKNLHRNWAAGTILTVLLLCAVGMTKSYAYDFSAVCETGQTLYYNITNAEYHYVELTCPVGNSWSGYEQPIGDLVLPTYVYDADNNQYLLTSIGSRVFFGCSGLTSVTIPNSVSSICSYAFYYCNGLTSVTIPNSVISIDDAAFNGCSGLTSVTIPDSVTTIGSWAFKGCSGLTSITIPNSVTSIGDSAFNYCSGLTQIIVDSGNVVYDSRENCNAIIKTNTDQLIIGCNNSVIPNSVTSIGDSAFSGCSSLTSIEIPNSVTWIGDYAFSECHNLTSIEIPNSVTSIGGNPFIWCSSLEQIIVDSGNTVYDSRENCNAIIVTSTNQLKSGCKNTVIPNSVTSIGDSAFVGCSGLISITIPNSVTSIGDSAFSGCSGLTSISIPNSVTEIRRFTFNMCISLTSITIGNSVASIGSAAFQGCSAIRYIYALPEVPPLMNYYDSHIYDVSPNIPIYVPCSAVENYQTVSGWSPFTNIIGLCSGEVEVIADPFEGGTVTGAGYYSGGDVCVLTATPNSGFVFAIWTENGIIVSMDMVFSFYAHPTTIRAKFVPVGNIIFADANVKAICVTNWDTNGDGELSYVEAAAVTDLGNVFYNSQITSFEELQYFVGLSSICNNAFRSCYNLTSIEIPSSVTSIGDNTFSYCHNLTSIEIPNSVTSIGNHGFYYCNRLTSIEIPNSVTIIGEDAFSSCSNLTSIEIPNSVTSIGGGAFVGCSGLEQILVESGNTVYDSRANCNAIIHTSTNELIIGCKNTIIPNSVTLIGSSAFLNCSGLTSVIIPKSVTSIGNYVFSGCSGLSSIIMMSVTPPTLGTDAFCFTDIEILKIYVPYESLNAYKTATNWNSYEDRIFPMSYTTIPGYGEDEGNYRFIASPLVGNTDPLTVDNMINEAAYDLYRFDQSEDAEWQNYKANSFNLVNGQGYLYANAEDVNIVFKGNFNEDESKEVSLTYDANATFAGWNLVGNPFPISAYANRSYYMMNEDGTAVEPNLVSSATPISACRGIMVMAEAEGETIVFSTEAPETAPDKGCLQIALSQIVNRDSPSTIRQAQGSGTLLDKAIVSFNTNDRLEKFVFNKDNARISIPQGGKDLAIACTDKQGELPLNFKATKNGQYTITVNGESVEMDCLHLIDNLTGADVDLLVVPSYTFEAKTTDYASRFRLVFSTKETDGPSTGSGTFAFISNGNIIVNGEGVLQIVDVMGRIIVSGDVLGNVSTTNMIPGVYVLRLINSNDVKTQKIVIE